LAGKVALITGAARGQGEAEARLFAAEGAKVVIADVLSEAGQEIAADLGDDALFAHLDVTDEQRWVAVIDAAVERFGGVDVLVNNAGIFRPGGVADQTLADYHAVIGVNQVGCFLGMRAVVPAMRTRGGGAIVNISSVSGIYGVPNVISYVASKFAIRGMTRAAAVELGPDGIRVNAVFPGPVATDMLNPGKPGIVPDGLPPLPLGRAARPEELANVVCFLASDDSSFCTGGEFVVDGGRTAGPMSPSYAVQSALESAALESAQ
jgi:3alpha(or 20beta)-hydroxysteroid dehydrogenase